MDRTKVGIRQDNINVELVPINQIKQRAKHTEPQGKIKPQTGAMLGKSDRKWEIEIVKYEVLMIQEGTVERNADCILYW